MKRFAIVFLLLVFCHEGYSQQNPPDLIKKFFDTYQKDSDKAIDDIYTTNPWTSEISEAIADMKKTVRSYPETMGKFYGTDLITLQKCTERFHLYVYMARYDRQPMRVIFEFYKPDEKWIIYSLNFDSGIDEDLEEAAKQAIQKPK
jgi:hypothetical protein